MGVAMATAAGRRAASRVSHDDMRFHGAGCTCPTRIPYKVGSDVAAIAVFLTTAAITTSRGFTDDRQALVQHSPEQTQQVSPLSSAAAVFVVRRINSGPSDGRRPCGPCLPGDPLLIPRVVAMIPLSCLLNSAEPDSRRVEDVVAVVHVYEP